MPWERLREREFWSWLFESEELCDEPSSFQVRLTVAEQGLELLIDEGRSVTLTDVASGAELGWLDDAHWHPSCLRPTEVLAIAASQAPELAARALLLLLPFAVVTTDDEGRRLAVAANEAWAALGFEGECPGLELAEFRDQAADWHLDARGRWCLRQTSAELARRPLYTLRAEANAAFPAWLSALG